MPRPRVSVARLMVVILIFGLVLGALRNNAQKSAEIAKLKGQVDQIKTDAESDHMSLLALIQEMGGIVDFDLPPPGAGKETGTLLPRIDWYVVDARPACPVGLEVASPPSQESLRQEFQFRKRMGDATKEARLKGIRPMPIERLLSFLGYDMTPPAVAGSHQR